MFARAFRQGAAAAVTAGQSASVLAAARPVHALYRQPAVYQQMRWASDAAASTFNRLRADQKTLMKVRDLFICTCIARWGWILSLPARIFVACVRMGRSVLATNISVCSRCAGICCSICVYLPPPVCSSFFFLSILSFFDKPNCLLTIRYCRPTPN